MKRKLIELISVVTLFAVLFIGCQTRTSQETETNKNLIPSTDTQSDRYPIAVSKRSITKTYPASTIEELVTQIEKADGEYTYTQFKEKFEVECFRETHQGGYAILRQDDGKYAFIFIDENDRLKKRIIIVDDFPTKSEFEEKLQENPTISQMLDYDHNTLLSGFSAVTITKHIVQEGVYIVTYQRFPDIEIGAEPIYGSAEFIPNEELLTNEDVYVRDFIPYILPMDKKSD